MVQNRLSSAPPIPLRIVIIDDEALLVSLLEAWLGNRPWVRVAGTAHTGRDGIALCRRLRPDIALLDVAIPDLSGLDVARQVRTESPDTRILILSGHFEPLLIHQALRIGVHGYLEKHSSLDKLDAALRRLAEGKTAFSDVFYAIREGWLALPDSFHKILSDPEMEIIVLVMAGFNDSEIAARQGIAVNTVITHRRNIRKKLNIHSDRELIAYAKKWGLVPHTEPDIQPG